MLVECFCGQSERDKHDKWAKSLLLTPTPPSLSSSIGFYAIIESGITPLGERRAEPIGWWQAAAGLETGNFQMIIPLNMI